VITFTLIVIVFFAYRFINIEKRIIFDWDQEQFSNQIKDILVYRKFTLLGPRVTDVEGFFLAPYFTYILVPFYFLNNLHPSGLIPFLFLVNICFVFFAVFVISKYFSIKHSFIFLLLWAINPLLVQYDTIPWWPLLIPLGVIVTWYLLFRIYNDQSKKSNWIILGLVLGFFCNMHFQFVFIVIFSIIFLVVSFHKKINLCISKMFYLFLAFLLMFVPLFIFDLRHDFLNTHLVLGYFSKTVITSKDIYAWHPVFNNFIRALLPMSNEYFSNMFILLLPLFSSFMAFKKEKMMRMFYVSTTIILLLTIIGFSYYGKRPSEYYFVFLYPFIYMLIIDFFARYKMWLLLIIVAILYVLNYSNLQNKILDNNNGLFYKDLAIKTIIPYTKRGSFNISLNVPLGRDYGFKYLIDYYGISQSGDYSDPLIKINMPPEENDLIINSIGISIPKELQSTIYREIDQNK